LEAEIMALTIAPAKRAKNINDWTSQDHGVDCPMSKWAKLPVDQRDSYNRQLTVEQREAFTKKTGASPTCNMLEGVCCPEDIVINAGIQPVIIGAPGEKSDGRGIGQDSPRMDIGDRRQGDYYLGLARSGQMPGLQQVKKVSFPRLQELEKTRQIRVGERPADWILKQRAKSARGEGPTPFEDKHTAMSEIQKAVYGAVDAETRVGPLTTSRPDASLGM
jgi:hypothetical protein